MTVTTRWRSSPYTDSSTQTVSASARSETQAPGVTKVPALVTCTGSSLQISRTSTFVSTARMLAPDSGPNSGIHAGNINGILGRGKDRFVDVP